MVEGQSRTPMTGYEPSKEGMIESAHRRPWRAVRQEDEVVNAPPRGPVGPGRIYAPDARDQLYAVTTEALDFVMERASAADRPAWKTGPRTDQGTMPSCVGHAWFNFLQAAPIMTRKRKLPPPTEIYHGAQRMDEWPGEAYAGTSVRGGAKYVQSLGLIHSYHWIYDLETLDYYLNAIGPVIIGIDWFQGMNRTRGGFVSPTGAKRGGHAFMVNDKSIPKDAYSCINSWGLEWGENGRFFIDRQDMQYLLFGLNGEACAAIEVT